MTNGNFGSLISQILTDPDLDDLATPDEKTAERDRMLKFRFEYFIVNIGQSTFRGEGSSVAKRSTNTQVVGVAYKIYGCGMMMPDKDSSRTEPPLNNASRTSLTPKLSESKELLTSPLLKKTSPLNSPDGMVSKPLLTFSSLNLLKKELLLMKLLMLFPLVFSSKRLRVFEIERYYPEGLFDGSVFIT